LSFQAKTKKHLNSTMTYESILSHQGKLCLNSYEQQLEIDSRIKRLAKALETTDAFKIKTETTRNNLKEKLNTHLNALRPNLNNLEKKVNQRLDTGLSQKNCDSRVRSIESDVNQLIGSLRNMSMLTDSQKLLMLKSIDVSINQLEANICQMESDKSQTCESLTTEIEKVKRFENAPVPSLSVNFTSVLKMDDGEAKKMLGLNGPYNYRDWLLKTASDSKRDNDQMTVLLKTDSFEVLSGFTQGDFELISDSDENIDDDSEEYFLSTSNKKSISNPIIGQPSTSVFFSDIYSKPMECWLLPNKQ
jgi:hypothetical protein